MTEVGGKLPRLQRLTLNMGSFCLYCWDYRCIPPCQVYAVVGIKPRAWGLVGRKTINLPIEPQAQPPAGFCFCLLFLYQGSNILVTDLPLLCDSELFDDCTDCMTPTRINTQICFIVPKPSPAALCTRVFICKRFCISSLACSLGVPVGMRLYNPLP